jgi:hypothetical protein
MMASPCCPPRTHDSKSQTSRREDRRRACYTTSWDTIQGGQYCKRFHMPDVSEAFLLNSLDLSLRTVAGAATREAICRVLLVRPARVLGITRLFRGNSWDFARSVFPPQSSVFPAKVLTASRRSRVGGLDFRFLGQAAYRSRVAHSKRFPSPPAACRLSAGNAVPSPSPDLQVSDHRSSSGSVVIVRAMTTRTS